MYELCRITECENAFGSCRRADGAYYRLLPVRILYSEGALTQVYFLFLVRVLLSIILFQESP